MKTRAETIDRTNAQMNAAIDSRNMMRQKTGFWMNQINQNDGLLKRNVATPLMVKNIVVSLSLSGKDYLYYNKFKYFCQSLSEMVLE
jgi:hypothetical protein